MTESEILFPNGKSVKIGEVDIQVNRMKLHQIIKSAGLLSGVFDVIFYAFNSEKIDISKILEIFTTDGDNILEFMCIAIGKDRKFINELEMDEAIELLIAIVEVNGDFFVSKVMPMLNSKTESLKLSKKNK